MHGGAFGATVLTGARKALSGPKIRATRSPRFGATRLTSLRSRRNNVDRQEDRI